MADNIERIPPRALEAEQAVLGAMLIDKEAITKAVDIITEIDFYNPANRRLYVAMRDMYIENQPVDIITLGDELNKRKELSEIGGAAYITSLINSVTTSANVEYYASIVRDKSVLRQLIRTGSNIVDSAFNGKYSPEQILDDSESELFNIAQKRASRGFTHVAELVHPSLEMLEKLHTDKKDIPGLRTGFADFDKMTAGLQPSELIVIAARPSMGKTAFALNIAENVALNEKLPVAIFSLEMSKEALMLRLLCSSARVDAHKTRQGYIGTQDWAKLTTAASRLAEAPLYIDDSSSLSILELRARARRLATELKAQGKKLSLVLVDYIQIMNGSGRTESRQQEISDISRSLKSLARDLQIPVVALSQLSRKPEEKGREGKPQLSDLRESGAIEQDADVVGFIFREGYYKKDDPDLEKSATLIIGKQRNGPTGEISLVFEKSFTRFEDLTRIGV